MENLKAFAEAMSPFGTLIVAAIVAYIAYRQYRTEHGKLKLELYDRRFDVFRAGMKFITLVVQNGNPDDEALRDINNAKIMAFFLFPKEVSAYYETLYDKGLDLQTMKEELRQGDELAPDERTRMIHERAEIMKWFVNQFRELRSKLRPYMAFD